MKRVQIIDNGKDDYYKNSDGLWGESLSKLKNRLVYQRKSQNMLCIYCGKNADTREHCPPRSFLKEPYPPDLKVLPACSECNNDFSKYENKFLSLMNNLEKGSEDDSTDRDILLMKIDHILPNYARNVLEKVAMGHAIYQLSDGFKDMIEDKPTIDFLLKSQVSQDQWNELQHPVIIDVIPELGSRESDSVFVIAKRSADTSVSLPICLVDWTDVQQNVYKYISYLSGDRIVVKMILRNVLYVQVGIYLMQNTLQSHL